MKQNKKIILMLIRYLSLLGLLFALPLIYKILTPVTIYLVSGLLKIFINNISVYENIIIINFKTKIEIIPACIAGSAYLLLLILNLSLPMPVKKRVYSIILSFLLLFTINILRIFSLSILYYNKFPFFEFTHKFFWYFLSTIFVIIIWFLIIKIFSIKEIPIYSDINSLINKIKKTKAIHT